MDEEMAALSLRHQHRLKETRSFIVEKPSEPILITSVVKLVPYDWASESDPANPKNWSPLALDRVLATSIFIPAIPYIQQEFDCSNIVAVLGVSLYLVGVTVGSTLGAPISELFGRRLIYLISLPILMGFSVAAASAQSIGALLVARLIGGLGGSLCISVGGGTITDIWDMKSSGVLAGLLYLVMPFLSPTIGPLTGAYIIHDRNDWRWSLWLVAILAAPVYFSAVFMKETSKDEILRSRFNSLGLGKEMPSRPQGRNSVYIAVSRTLTMLLTEPLVLTLAIYTSFSFAIIFVFFDVFPLAFTSIYGFSDEQVSLTFLSLLVGFLLAIINFAICAASSARKVLISGAGPERHMHCALIGSIMLPGSLFWLAFTCQKNIHWIVPVLAGVPFGWSTLNIFLSSLMYLLASFPPKYSASATAALGVLRYTFGAVFPLFATQMYEALEIKWTCVLLAGVSAIMLPVPWILVQYGEKLRIKSLYNDSAPPLITA